VGNKCTWLEFKADMMNGEPCVSLDEVKAKFEVRDICEYGWLVLNPKPWDDSKNKYDGWIEFAVLEFLYGDSSFDGVHCKVVIHGGGPSSSLREPRHFYFGENGDGYLFYPSKKVIEAAFKALEEFYDFN
jgi:hypothetical protein